MRVVCTLVTFISHFAGVYCNGAMTRFDCVYIYVLLIVNASQIWAMYCLVLFYHATLSELRPIRPFPKFVCVKVVVFLSFWQAVLIAGLVHFGVIQATLSYSVSEIADGLQVSGPFVCAVSCCAPRLRVFHVCFFVVVFVAGLFDLH